MFDFKLLDHENMRVIRQPKRKCGIVVENKEYRKKIPGIAGVTF